MPTLEEIMLTLKDQADSERKVTFARRARTSSLVGANDDTDRRYLFAGRRGSSS